jgi:ribosomal protein S27AE
MRTLLSFGVMTVEIVECPRCGLDMVPVDDHGYRYMSCKCGEELETDVQRKWNDQRFREEQEW